MALRPIVRFQCSITIMAVAMLAITTPLWKPAYAYASDNPLLSNTHLSTRITLKKSDTTFGQVLHDISHTTDVHLIVGEDIAAINENPVNVNLNDLPLRDVMDAMASLYQLRWERVREGLYSLRQRKDFLKGLLPYNEQSRIRAEAGKKFLAEYLQTSPEEAQSLTAKNRGLRFDQLSPAMQSQVRIMLNSMIAERKESSLTGPFETGEDLSSMKITVDARPQAGFNSYFVGVGGTRGFMGWQLNDLAERMQAEEEAARQSKTPEPFNPQDFTLSSEEVKDRVAGADRTVTIDAAESPVSHTADALAQQLRLGNSNGSYVMDVDRFQAPPATLSFHSVTLTKALADLPKLYPDTEWEIRQSGVLIVRAPSNSGRTPKKAS